MSDRYAVVTSLADVRMRKLKWLWLDRIPTGVIAMLAGRGGEGKSTFGLWLAAQLTLGALPGEYQGVPRNVLYVAFEDDAAAIVKPRALAAGADTAHIQMLAIRRQGYTLDAAPSLLRDLELIETQVRALDAVAVIVDPLSSGLNGINRDRSSEVRPALDGIAEMAARTGCAVIAIAHFSKGGGDVRDKISGSHEYVDRARAVLVFATDEDGSKLMEQTKGNYGRGDLPNVAFAIEPHEVAADGWSQEVGAVRIIGETFRSVGDIINADLGDSAEELNEAQAWLIEHMREQEAYEARAGDVIKAGRAASFTDQRVKDARRRFNKLPPGARQNQTIGTYKAAGCWLWRLEPDSAAS
ncbi:AAA family ATPase [Microbacterium sp.]|uniref:AAA family ATPase n=1 Tax=Microbacterium sp. TaxID=51671 RepID=UPI0028117A1B|nr:AAA family ATPase [Microbacterium sp.]